MLKKILALLVAKKGKEMDLDLIMIDRQTDLMTVNEIYPSEKSEFQKEAELWTKKDPIICFERFMMIITITNINLEKKEILRDLIEKIIKEKDEGFFVGYHKQCDIIYCKIYEQIKQANLESKEKNILSEVISLVKEKIKKNQEIKKNLEEISFLLSQ
ncbi:MAG TPA: hypothetical protein PKD96_00090 [Candidatus Absconditabacterales bacterium]|nr:hypothetical protein [Candidatus Absconditabacterales bacterium]HMT26681.1 hypothetical protein [Candidatus Absconditabacterales bacterium]